MQNSAQGTTTTRNNIQVKEHQGTRTHLNIPEGVGDANKYDNVNYFQKSRTLHLLRSNQ